jgi:hypothetical protein
MDGYGLRYNGTPARFRTGPLMPDVLLFMRGNCLSGMRRGNVRGGLERHGRITGLILIGAAYSRLAASASGFGDLV